VRIDGIDGSKIRTFFEFSAGTPEELEKMQIWSAQEGFQKDDAMWRDAA
jgi:hypothetical protein